MDVGNVKWRFKFLCALLFAVSLGVQFFYIDDVRPFQKYPSAARAMLLNDVNAVRPSDFSAGYLLMHVGVQKMLGESAHVMARIQVFVEAASVVVIFMLTALYTDLVYGFISALLATFLTPFLVYGAVLEPEIWICFFNLLTMFFFTVGLQSSKRSQWFFMSVCCGGLSVTLRPTFVPILGFLVILATLGTQGLKKRLFLLFGLSAASVVPYLFINHLLGTQVQTTSQVHMSPDQVFHQGNNPAAVGALYAYPPVIKWMEEDLRAPDAAHLAYAMISSHPQLEPVSWFGLSKHFLGDYPRQALNLLKNRVLFTLNRFDFHDLFYADEISTRLSQYMRVKPGFVIALGLVGLLVIILSASQRKAFFPWVVYGLVYGSSLATFFVSARQRLPLYLAWLVLGGAVWNIWKEKKKSLLMGAGIVSSFFIIYFFLVSASFDARDNMASKIIQDRQFSLEHQMADDFLSQGAPEMAKAHLIKAIAQNPNLELWIWRNGVKWDVNELKGEMMRASQSDWLDLARAEWLLHHHFTPEGMDRLSKVASHMDQVQSPLKSSKLALLKGLGNAQQNDMEAAKSQWRQSLNLRPANIEALTYLALVGDDASELALKRYHDPLSILYQKSFATADMNRWVDSLSVSRQITQLFPKLTIAVRQSCKALKMLGRFDEAQALGLSDLGAASHYLYDCVR